MFKTSTKTKALLFAVALLVLAPAAAAQTVVVSVVSTPEGPQVYQTGSIKGWTVEESVFTDASTNSVVMGPLVRGTPSAPQSSVTLTVTHGDPAIKEWIGPRAVWQPELVLFCSAHEQGGAGTFLDLVPSWPRRPPRTNHLFSVLAA